MTRGFAATRRELLVGTGAIALGGVATTALAATTALLPARVEPLPLRDVRLLPSPFLDAVEANRRYLLSLEPDRLLHYFRKGAGLAPKGAAYGGWESDTIAGHTLGHYLSALALIHAQTGEPEAKRRVDYIVTELAACQKTVRALDFFHVIDERKLTGLQSGLYYLDGTAKPSAGAVRAASEHPGCRS